MKQIGGFHKGGFLSLRSDRSDRRVRRIKQKLQTRQIVADKTIKDIAGATRKRRSAEVKIRIVLNGLRVEERIDELCRHAGIAQSILLQMAEGVSVSLQSSACRRYSSCGFYGQV